MLFYTEEAYQLGTFKFNNHILFTLQQLILGCLTTITKLGEEFDLIDGIVFRYSMGIRQKVAEEFGSSPNKAGKLGKQHSPDVIVTPQRTERYHEELASSVFCGVMPGDGWSGRMEDSILQGCIPVVIQVLFYSYPVYFFAQNLLACSTTLYICFFFFFPIAFIF